MFSRHNFGINFLEFAETSKNGRIRVSFSPEGFFVVVVVYLDLQIRTPLVLQDPTTVTRGVLIRNSTDVNPVSVPTSATSSPSSVYHAEFPWCP